MALLASSAYVHAPAGAAPQLLAGSCLLTLEATWVAAEERVLLADDGAGTCATNFGLGTPSIQAAFSDISDIAPITCANAIGDGLIDVSLAFGSDSIELEPALLAVSKIGDSVTIGFTTLDETLNGVGQFVQTTPTAIACTEGTNPLIWTGVLTFEDPVLIE